MAVTVMGGEVDVGVAVVAASVRAAAVAVGVAMVVTVGGREVGVSVGAGENSCS
jgi:hypothetical protein